MSLQCPRCSSSQVDTNDFARKLGGAAGTAAGAAIGYASASTGAELGAAVGLLTGGPAGVLIGALIGGSMGCLTGVKLGEIVDHNVLNNCRCLQCGYAFRRARPASESTEQAVPWLGEAED